MDKYEKQVADVQDYDLSYVDWLADLNDTALSLISTSITGSDAAATIAAPVPSMAAGVVKVWVTGGTDGVAYKITALILTVAGRKKEHEIMVKVKDH